MDKKIYAKDPAKPPCQKCNAACCKQYDFGDSGAPAHSYAVLLYGDEVERFEDVAIETDDGWGLPYKNKRCVFLGKDDRCSVYEKRPQGCRDFSCAFISMVGKPPIPRLSYFIEDNLPVLRLVVKEEYWTPRLIDLLKENHSGILDGV